VGFQAALWKEIFLVVTRISNGGRCASWMGQKAFFYCADKAADDEQGGDLLRSLQRVIAKKDMTLPAPHMQKEGTKMRAAFKCSKSKIWKACPQLTGSVTFCSRHAQFVYGRSHARQPQQATSLLSRRALDFVDWCKSLLLFLIMRPSPIACLLVTQSAR